MTIFKTKTQITQKDTVVNEDVFEKIEEESFVDFVKFCTEHKKIIIFIFSLFNMAAISILYVYEITYLMYMEVDYSHLQVDLINFVAPNILIFIIMFFSIYMSFSDCFFEFKHKHHISLRILYVYLGICVFLNIIKLVNLQNIFDIIPKIFISVTIISFIIFIPIVFLNIFMYFFKPEYNEYDQTYDYRKFFIYLFGILFILISFAIASAEEKAHATNDFRVVYHYTGDLPEGATGLLVVYENKENYICKPYSLDDNKDRKPADNYTEPNQ